MKITILIFKKIQCIAKLFINEERSTRDTYCEALIKKLSVLDPEKPG